MPIAVVQFAAAACAASEENMKNTCEKLKLPAKSFDSNYDSCSAVQSRNKQKAFIIGWQIERQGK